ncbi:MAG: hypothetical protein ACOYY2_02945 [Actinomycetota bacterium]
MTERDILDRLARRYCRAYRNGAYRGRRYVYAEHVRRHPNWGQRVLDAMAIDTWGSGRFGVAGFEVKATRSDWLAELRNPSKAGVFLPYCRAFYLVAASPDIVRDDLPAGWGLLVPRGRGLTEVRPSLLLREPEPMPPELLAGLARAAVNTAHRVGPP